MKVEAIIKNRKVTLCLLDGKIASKVKGGFCRQVFYCNGYFIKFDNPAIHGDECGVQTKLELELLNKIEAFDKGFFCLPESFGEIDGLWYTVQKEVKNEQIPDQDARLELAGILNKYNLSDIGCGYNCAYTKDGWKIYDYAMLMDDFDPTTGMWVQPSLF